VLEIATGCPDYVGPRVFKEIGKLWKSGHDQAIGWFQNDEFVAGVTFTNFDGVNVWMDCAAEPATRWLDRRGLWAIFHYVFEQLGCVRCSAMIPEDNYKSLKLVQSAGFEHEATLERAAPDNKNMLVFRMFKEHCRWLARKAA
jgi:RimJ/RimL family protein N-acetyltransferase